VNMEGSQELVGRLLTVKIISAFSHSLRGEMPAPDLVS
jgi:hypothetical protein